MVSSAYVVNIRDGEAAFEGDTPVRVDRANPVLGNPIRLRSRGDMAERERVLRAHEALVLDDIAKDGPISRALDELADRVAGGETLALQCWCAPLPCHADVLARVVNERVR